RSRGQVNHLLVGLRIDGDAFAEAGAALTVDGRTTGELTSVVRSPSLGWIALGYVRREHAEAGTRVELAGGGSARIADLPFVPLASPVEPDTAVASSSRPAGRTPPPRLPSPAPKPRS